MDNMKLITFKDNLTKALINVYQSHGYNTFCATCDNLIKNSTAKAKKELGDAKLGIQIRGEVCEAFLKISIVEFCKINKTKNWFMHKGLCLERKDGKKNKTTELDITLFTPNKVVLFESKFRMNKVEIYDQCKIVPDYGTATNVWSQNIMHLDNLKWYLADSLKSLELGKPFKCVLFMYSNKDVKDLRSKKYRNLMPVVTKENLFSYLKTLTNSSVELWDIKSLRARIQLLDNDTDRLFKQHMKEVAK